MSTRFRSLFILMALLLATSLVLAACGDATSTTAPASTTAAAGTSAGTSAGSATTAASAPSTGTGNKPTEIRLDYAYYNPSSLVLKKFGWLESDLAADKINVKWVLSTGSNKANEYVSANSIDFGSTAGAAALLARTNNVPLKTVYVYSKPEWTALVVPGNSTITKVEQLKGKKIAVTRGTDPFFFLLRILKDAGLSQSDVEIVNLQHPDGRTALQRGQVDAWVGLDPHMAAAELEDGAKIIYRNIDYNTYGTLNAREDFLKQYPDYARKVIAEYEKARQWILANPDQAAQILSDEAKLSLPVAKKELVERTVLDPKAGVGVPGDALKSALTPVVPILTSEKLVPDDANPTKALSELIDPTFASAVIK